MEKVSDRFGGFGGSKLGSVTEVRIGAAVLACCGCVELAACFGHPLCPASSSCNLSASRTRFSLRLPPCLLQVGSIEDLDAYYERLGTFTGLYARHIFNRMSKTVPKAIILCQVGGREATALGLQNRQAPLAVGCCEAVCLVDCNMLLAMCGLVSKDVC